MSRKLRHIEHMLTSIERIQQYKAPGRETFEQSQLIRDAVFRNLTTLSNAASRVDEQYRSANPDIPWEALATIGRLIHDYMDARSDLVWETIDRDLPLLQSRLRHLLK